MASTPQQRAPAARQPRSSKTACIIAVVAGCGCLLVVGIAIAIYLGVLGGLWFTQHHSATDEATPEAPGLPDAEMPGPMTGPAPAGDTQTTPGEPAAIGWASRRSPGWAVRIDDYSENWSWVRLIMGPAQSEWTTWLEIEWDASAGDYRLLDEGPMGYDGGDASAEGPGPTEAGAVQTALDAINRPAWATRIQEHSADWRRVTVWAGPPQSEWACEITVTWDDDLEGYVVQQVSEVPYP